MNINTRISVEIPDDLFGTEEIVARIPETVADIVREARNFWESEAGRRLKDKRRDVYQDALRIRQGNDGWSLELEGKVANDIEAGFEPFDMKPGMLAGPKARMGPKGRYNIIPIDKTGAPVALRTVTENSPANSWIHPGFKGVDIATDVHREIMDNLIPKHIEILIDEVTK